MAQGSEDEALASALRAVVRHTQGATLTVARAAQLARMSGAARAALDAVSSPTLFDTEPADVRVLLEDSEGSP